MKLLRFCCFLLLPVLLSCHHGSGNKSSKENIISRDKMVAVLVDIHLVEAKIKVSQDPTFNKDYYTKIYFDSILKKNAVTAEQFRQSLLYYQDDIDKMDKIYADVISQLTMYQGRLSAP